MVGCQNPLIGFKQKRQEPEEASTMPEQYRAIGWVAEKLYALIFEVREDRDGEYYHLVTLWKATKQEHRLYEEHS